MTTASCRPFLRAFITAVVIAALVWIMGGQALLGRIDPALAVPLLVPPMLLLAFWQRGGPAVGRLRTCFLSLVLLAMVQGLLVVLLAGSTAWLQLLLIFFAGGLAALLADLLIQWRSRFKFLPSLTGVLLVVGWFGASHAGLAILYRPAAAPVNAPAVTMLTGLPLRWSTGGGRGLAAMVAEGANDDPALARLTAAGPVALVDSLADSVLPAGGALLIAHPRALAPQELVVIDAFVRGGGRAVVLADALTGWPARYPLGDPRNPPITSLLTPLLDHWGVTLGAAPPAEGAALPVDVDGARLRLFSAGRFDRLPPQCSTYADRRVARCSIGKGEVWLVGDADLLFTPLWSPLAPGAAHLRQADTMQWLSARLWQGAGHSLLHPVWIRVRSS